MSDNPVQVNIITIPMIALRGISLFPGSVTTFEIERSPSIEAVNRADKKERLVFLAAQKNPAIDFPEEKDVYHIGVVGRIKQQLMPHGGGLCRIMVEGLYRAEASVMQYDGKLWTAEVTRLEEKKERTGETKRSAILRNLIERYYDYLQLAENYSPEAVAELMQFRTDSGTIDGIAQNIFCGIDEKQELLEELRPYKRAEYLTKIIAREIEILTLEHQINDAAQESINKNQREYFLREEMKAIEDELAEEGFEEREDYSSRIEKLSCSPEIKARLRKEASRLKKEPFGSSESSVIRNYLDTCLEIPWEKFSKETINIGKARSVLDKDHYGLEKVKQRVLEYLAVRQLSPDVKGGLLCFVGPPGTGKTSVAMSIARATGRKLVRVSLGGVHDEADIRGHRKTYIGAMPGRIVSGLIQAGTMNPLMVLDEIDKLGSDYRGDPSAALLEAFDGEQNSAFRDHFLEIPVDLSNVFFITTANTTDTIPPALLDRMEIIELSSYTDEEKVMIAKEHLIPKQRKKHGLTSAQLKISDDALRELISSYTKESGVRVLEREIAGVCRKAAAGLAEKKFKSLNVKREDLRTLCGPEKYKKDEIRESDSIGLVRGLAWTSVGGEVLDVEAAVVDGTGKTEITGNLGDVMQESVKAAVTCLRSRSSVLGIDHDFYKNKDIHIHFPEGAVPKDGPSAGVTIYTALVSALTGRPVRHDVAMTGEITLRGRVLPIGGLREKTMAALRNGVKTVIIPADNEPDLEEIDPLVRSRLNFITAVNVDTVLENALANEEVIPSVSSAQTAQIISTHDRHTVRQ
ncbi:MAG: endopeptidase La [Eubacteriales bacterium]|nr:endopeptidase La [Eubacteriales bacterium]